jgi:dTDP-4-dehydrorhamnose 3,5-epimerase
MSGRLTVHDLPLRGLFLIERAPIGDHRGYLERLFCADVLGQCGLNTSVAQINRTLTHRAGTVRGLHFQYPPDAEVKTISCIRGKVFDVAVDLRADSPTFLRWHGEILSAENHKALYVQVGFAHGFQTLENDCEMLYLHSATYNAAAEGGVWPLEPRISIDWPHDVVEMSPRDRGHRPLAEDFLGLLT